MKKTSIFVTSVLVISMALTACGRSNSNNGAAPPATAVVTISTKGVPSSMPIGGVQLMVTLPAGVSLKTAQNPPQTDNGVVAATGEAQGAELVFGSYSPNSHSGTVYIAKSTGFSVGEFATINCDIAAGADPQPSNFVLSNETVVDINGATVEGLTIVPTVSFGGP